MAVEAVVFDISETVLTDWRSLRPTPQLGIVEALDALRALGIVTLAAVNESRSYTITRLQSSGILSLFDHIVTKDDVGENKRSPKWAVTFLELTGLRANQFLYVGDSDGDMITATRGPLLYAHAAWAAEPGPYGLIAPAPGWIVAVVRHIFRKRQRWYWMLNGRDRRDHPVHAFTLLDANGANNETLRYALLDVFKDDQPRWVGQMLLQEFVMLHMLASVYDADLFGGIDLWTTYPGHAGAPNTVMGDFLVPAAKLSRNKYQGDVFIRHKVAKKSNVAYREGGIEGALRNQLTTIRLNEAHRARILGKRVLVLDNFLTWGPSTEAPRNLLLAAGASEMVAAGVGKYGPTFWISTAPDEAWDPFGTSPPNAGRFGQDNARGTVNPQALAEFLASYQGMQGETW